tara:strand:+ start:5131 stop:5529 length:399 start_codon:yes stop_codon:yes gene_type:complete
MTTENNTRWPRPSVTSVPEYQLSSLPYCKTKTTQSTANFVFPRVTRWITIHSDKAIDVFFVDDPSNAGSSHDNQHFRVAEGTTTPRLELRCAKIYVKSITTNVDVNISVIAGLTHITADDSVPESMLDWENL